MRKIKIVTDSTLDLSEETIKQYNIEVVPLSIHIDGKSYVDRVDITPTEFVELMKESKEIPKSSQPSSGSFLEVYDRLDDEGYDIISIHMTSGMSGTYNSAVSAKQLTKANVTVIDSKFISAALGFQVIEAAKLAEQGKSIEEIVERLKQIRENSELYIVVDTLDNLIKGGRIGRGAGMIGSLLNIKPIASLADGVYTPVTKVRSHSQVVKYLSKTFVEDVTNKTIKGVKIAHCEGLELARKVANKISELTGYDLANIDIIDTTPVISTHTGLGAIALLYYYE